MEMNGVVTKVIVDIILQVESQIKLVNETNKFSQDIQIFPSYLFTVFPQFEWIESISTLCELDKSVVFNHFYDYTSNQFDQIYKQFNSSDFCDMIRFSFYANVMNIVPKGDFKYDYSTKFLNFAATLPTDSKIYILLRNFLRRLSEFGTDLFSFYLADLTSFSPINFCDAAQLSVNSSASLYNFVQNLNSVYDHFNIEKKSIFLSKLSTFFANLSIMQPNLYCEIRDIENNNQIHVFLEKIINNNPNNNISRNLSLICALFTLCKTASNFQPTIFQSLSDFQSNKGNFIEYLESIVFLAQSFVMNIKSGGNNKNAANDQNLAVSEYVKSIKPVIENFFFFSKTISGEILTDLSVELILPRYIALEIANMPSNKIPSVISCFIRCDNINFHIALARGMILYFNGYPNDWIKQKNILLISLFNLSNNYIQTQDFNANTIKFHEIVFKLISGHSNLFDDFKENYRVIDFIADDKTTTSSFFLILQNEMACLNRYSADCVISFLVLCYTIFNGPSHWVKNGCLGNKSTEAIALLVKINRNIKKMYKNLFLSNQSFLIYFNAILYKYIKWVQFLAKNEIVIINSDFINSFEEIIYLTEATYNFNVPNLFDSEKFNEELMQLAESSNNLKFDLQEIKEKLTQSVAKTTYVLWFQMVHFYLNDVEKQSADIYMIASSSNKFTQKVTFKGITRVTTFLCQNSVILDNLQLLEKYKIKQPRPKFLNSLLDFIVSSKSENMAGFIELFQSLDELSTEYILKIIMTRIIMTDFHPNYIWAASSLATDVNKKSGSCFEFLENIILNILKQINMNPKYKDQTNFKYLIALSELATNVYSGYNKMNSLTRSTITSIILNFATVTIGEKFQTLTEIIYPLPYILKDFKITAETFSPFISDYENENYVRKTISCILSSLCFISSSNDEKTITDVCEESLENILFANFEVAWQVFVSSIFVFSDKFKKMIINSFIHVIKTVPNILSFSNKYSQFFGSNFQALINDNNSNSFRFYEAVIEVASNRYVLRDLFLKMCQNYDKSNHTLFFIVFFKNAATHSFITEFSHVLFKMNIERIMSVLRPPVQFVYYWQLLCKHAPITPSEALERYFLRPMIFHPQLYGLNHKPAPNLNIDAFLTKVKSAKALLSYVDKMMNSYVDYFEVVPSSQQQQLLTSQQTLTSQQQQSTSQQQVTQQQQQSNQQQTNAFEVISHYVDNVGCLGNYDNDFEINNVKCFHLFNIIQAQCLVNINRNKSTSFKDKWLFILERLPEDTIPYVTDYFITYFKENVGKVTLYVDMRNPPKYYLNAIKSILIAQVKTTLIYVPIGALREIETNLSHNLFGNLDVEQTIFDSTGDIILPFHISTCMIQESCKVNGKRGSIGFFQEFIVVSGMESFRGESKPVCTVFSNRESKLTVEEASILIEIDNGSPNFRIETNKATFFAEAIERSSGSLFGNKKSPLLNGFDPKVALLALSLLEVPNYGSIVSDASLKLFWLLISGKGASSNGSLLSLPLDGFIRTLQEKNLFESVVLFLTPFLSIASDKNMPMVASLLTSFLSTCTNEESLSGVCHHLLTHFNDESDIAKNSFQLLYIWSTAKSQIFTKIAIPQIAYYVESSVAQSQLIHCLSAKNKDAVNEVLIENMIYKDLAFSNSYRSIFCDNFYSIFPSVQFLGRDSKTLFLSIIAALSAPKHIAQQFIIALQVYFRSKKKKESESNKVNQNQNDNDNENENGDQNNIGDENKNENETKNENEIKIGNEISNENNSEVDNNFDMELFEPEKSNILQTCQQIFDSLDANMQNELAVQFESLNQEENPNVWYLKPGISTVDLLSQMIDSMVPTVNLKKLSYCLASLIDKKNAVVLFWVAVPFLLSPYQGIRILSIELIQSTFQEAVNIDPIDPFDVIIKSFKNSKNLNNVIHMFGNDMDADFENNLGISLTTIFMSSVIDISSKSVTIKLIKRISEAYSNKPEKAAEFVLYLLAFSAQYINDLLKPFSKGGNMSASDLIESTIGKKSNKEVVWMIRFLFWSISQPSLDLKFHPLAKCLLVILRKRSDIAALMKKDLLMKLGELLDKNSGVEQQLVSQMIAVVCTLPMPTNAKEVSLSPPFSKVLGEIHMSSHTVNLFIGAKEALMECNK